MKGTFKASYFLAFLVFVGIRIPHQWQRTKIGVEVDRRDGLEYLVMSLALVGMFFVPVAYASTSWLDGADYRWSSKTKGWAGAIGTAIISGALWLLDLVFVGPSVAEGGAGRENRVFAAAVKVALSTVGEAVLAINAHHVGLALFRGRSMVEALTTPVMP